ncbi:MAG: hypothetical protein K2Y21_01315 [Phycisphaerales bacterium]|nr:hypothetical protein [Phycisphaerales bacterium]
MPRAAALIFRVVSAGLFTLAAVTLTLWLVGRIFNDSFRWSQFIFWIPSIFTIVFSGMAAVLALSIQLFIKGFEQIRTGGPRELRPVFYKRYVRNPYVLLCVVWIAFGFWSAIFEHRLHASWGLADTGRVRNAKSTTVTFWNIGGRVREGWIEALRPIESDLIVVSNQPNWDVVNDFKTLGDAKSTTFLAGVFLVHTRLTLREWGFATLGIQAGLGFDPRRSTGRYEGTDPGYAMYLVFDAAGTAKEGLSTEFVVWLMDLPSDPTLSRQNVTKQALAAIDAWKGVATVRVPPDPATSAAKPDAPIQWENVPAEQLGRKGFPVPDLVIGDFNIPRGSRSLRNLVGDMENAYDQAGDGYTASYPRKVPFAQLDGPGLIGIVRWMIPSDVPFFHIDQAFVGPSLHATRYRTTNLGHGTHWAQVVELQAR